MTRLAELSQSAERAATGEIRWRRRVHTAQALILTILIAGLIYVADTVVGGSLFRDPDRVQVQLAGASGLHDGSPVNYRGQRVGKVSAVRLAEPPESARGIGAVAEIELEPDVDVPRDAAMEVRHLSAVGEQYLDIRPETAEGPYLADGDTVPMANVTLPIGVPDVLAHAQRLMARLDVDDIETITTEAQAIFESADQVDLRALSVELETAFAMLRDLEPRLARLARRAEIPLTTVADLDAELRTVARDLASVSRSIRQATPHIRGIVVSSTDLLPRLDRWWRQSSPHLRRLLRRGLPVAEMSAAHLRGLHEWLDWAPLQADAMAGSTRDGSGRVLLVPRILANCIYEPGYERDPHEVAKRRVPTDVHCTDPPAGTQQRGSANVPRQ